MMKIALFGGTFNPIHNGHINLIKKLDEKYSFDKIIVMPSKIPPHKEIEGTITEKNRYEFCKLAFEDYEKVEVSDFEICSENVSFTYLTIQYLLEKYENSQLFLVIGGDMFLYFEEWKNYKFILDNVIVLTASRNENEYEKLLLFKNQINYGTIDILKMEPMVISSTQVRELFKKNENSSKYSCYLPEKVVKYIVDNKLY